MDYQDDMTEDEIEHRKLVLKILAVVLLALCVSSYFRDSPHYTVPEGTICPNGEPARPYNWRGEYSAQWAVNEPVPKYVCMKQN